MNILRMSGLVLSVLVLCTVLKNCKSNLTIILVMGLSLIIFFYIADKIIEIFSQINIIREYVRQNSTYIAVILKIIGLTYVTQFTSDICRDNGYAAMASQLELFCRLLIAALTVPVVIALFKTVTQWAG